MLAQSVSTLVSPESPQPFERPGLGGDAWGVVHTKAEMDRLVAQARACPPGAFWNGSQLVAYLAGRRVPDDQPDGFIVARAKVNAAAFRRVQAAAPRCG